MSKIPTSFDERKLADLIRRPIVTEKATFLMEQNKYTFEVAPKATKPEIKAAIESIFDVSITKINTVTPPRKKRRIGRFVGYKPHYKKAIVTLTDEGAEKIRQVLFPEV